MSAASPLPLRPPGSAPELSFRVVDAGVIRHAAIPTLGFGVEIDAGEVPVRSILLDTQIQIAARRRAHDPAVHDRLFELFGPPSNWSATLRTLLWTRTTQVVPAFTGTNRIELAVPCTYDFEVTASKYLDAIGDGDVPLEFLFAGTVFYATEQGLLQTARIAWDREAEFRMPVSAWKETMDHYFPRSAWLRLGEETFARLHTYRSRHALTSWDAAVDALLDAREAQGQP